MGAHFGAIAIKTDKVNDVLEIADEYYHQYGLSLAEVSVGDNQSKYTKVKVKDISEFQLEYRSQKRNADVSVDFDFYFNLQENVGWIILQYDRKSAQVGLNIDSEFSSKLSGLLLTEVIEYYRYDGVNFLQIRKYSNGKLSDKFELEDGLRVRGIEGYFSKFDNKVYQGAAALQEEIEFPYLEKNGLDFEAEELDMYTNGQWRHFYLEGTEESIKNYLSHLP